jgi:hypothetical protein
MIGRVVSPILKDVPPIIEPFNNFLRGAAPFAIRFASTTNQNLGLAFPRVGRTPRGLTV